MLVNGDGTAIIETVLVEMTMNMVTMMMLLTMMMMVVMVVERGRGCLAGWSPAGLGQLR